MTDQMTPDEMREAAKRLWWDAENYMPDDAARDVIAGAGALDALAAIKDMLPGPRTFAESLVRDYAGKPFPRMIDADKVAGIIAGAFAYGETNEREDD